MSITAVDRLYTDSAREYGCLWAPVTVRLAAPLFDELPLADASRVLDVGAGTGGSAPAITVRAPAALMVGVDRVGEMLHRVPPIMRPAVMDASRLALHSEAFDVAFSAFVLFFVPDPIAALRELRRVVVPGGAVGFTSWGDEPVYPAWQAWNEELTRVGLAPSPSLRHDQLNTVEKVATALDAAGLVAGRVWARRVDIPADADGFLQRMLAFGGRRRLAALSRTKRKCCLDRIRRRLADLEPADLSDRSEVIYAVGRRPGR